MIQQAGGAVPQSPLELVLSASPETKVVLVITAIFSLVSWFIIILKWWQFSLSMTQLEALKMVLGKEVAAERDLLGHYIPWLATIGSVSPLLGLTGTVFGIMRAFIGIASKGSGNLAAVAPGVAEALVATASGLLAAIPAVIAYNLYVNRVRLFAGELEGFANELIGTMAREGLV